MARLKSPHAQPSSTVYGATSFPSPVGRTNMRWWLRLSVAVNIAFAVLALQSLHHSRSHTALQQSDTYGTVPKDGVQQSDPQIVEMVVEKVVEKKIKVEVPVEKIVQVGSSPGPRQCGMCDVNPRLCEELGADNVARAQGYIGSNARLRRALAKMRRGEPFNVGVLGGSVSKGHGIKYHDMLYAPQNMHTIIFNWLNAKFPGKARPVIGDTGKPTGTNGFINGAQGGMGSDYFSMCFREHITDDVDLVLIELAINDERLMKNQDSFELMVRGVMALPGDPAIINLQVLALVFPNLSLGGDMHAGLAEYYDIPTLSLRNLWLHQILQNYTMMEDIFVPDPDAIPNENTVDGFDQRHIGMHGHRVMGDLVTTYLETQLCEMDRIEATAQNKDVDTLYPPQAIPRVRAVDKFDKNKVMAPIRPNCFSTNGLKSKLVPVENYGWRDWNWEEKKYIIADEPGSKISFKFETVVGSVELFYQRSAKFGFGNVKCWVDDDRDKFEVIEGYWDLQFNIGRSATVRDDLSPGEHMLHCQLLEETADPGGGKEFRIISVMSV